MTEITKPTWVRWRYGWGETWRIAPGLELTVGKGTSREDKFFCSFLDYISEPHFETMELAKEHAVTRALAILSQGLSAIS